MIMAFFPCIYFCQQNTTFMDGTNINWKGKPILFKANEILERSRKRQYFFELILKLFVTCDTRKLRLIVENPYSPLHYLNNNFLYKPTIIDKNRQLRGDYFIKPTQYFFVNCEPKYNMTFFESSSKKSVNKLHGHKGSHCDEERSMISPDYARNFIFDFILGRKQENTQLTLF